MNTFWHNTKLFGKQIETRLGRFTHRIKCPKCGGYNHDMNIFFHNPCTSCGYMAGINTSIKERFGDHKEVGRWEITETRFKVFGVSFKTVKTFKWIPSVKNIENFDFIRDELEQDFYH